MSAGTRSRLPLAGALVLVALIGAGLTASLVVRAPIPRRSGRARLPGLSAPAEVRFDRRAVPHVRAVTEIDAVRVLGWLHAGDRLLQMELRRRAAAGRISELFGSVALEFDKGARTRAALGGGVKAELQRLSPRLRQVLEAYAQGVNAYVESSSRPWELVVLGVRPEPWTALDCLRTARVISSSVTDAEGIEAFRFDAARRIGAGPFLRLLDAAQAAPTFVPEGFPYERAAPPAGTAEPAPRGGSNAWALSGSRTASGRPLLASDPHLPPEMPGVWYAAHLSTRDGLDVAGLTLAGIPGVVIGHNGAAAWGLTMTQADDADLFVEKISGGSYVDRAGTSPLEVREERIRIKGAADVELAVRSTRHGPIVKEYPGGIALALSWAAMLSPGSIEAFLSAARAQDPAAIHEAWRSYGGPPVNVTWATASGHVGVFVAGAIPSRPIGDGRLPVPGFSGDHDWNGLVPSSELPSIEDPPEGFVASANDDWSAAGKKISFPGEYAGRERIDRIRAVLAATGNATIEPMRSLQNDVLSRYAERVCRALSGLAISDPRALRARDVLASWDRRVLRRGPGRLFEAFLVDARRRTFTGREGRDQVRVPVGLELLASMIEGTRGAELWDDPGTPAIESREAIVSVALASSLDRVEQEDGKVVAAWNWGRAHTLTYPHLFSSASKLVARILDKGPIELPGDTTTVDVSGSSLRSGSFEVLHIPSARLLVDLGDPDRTRLVLPLGQSGHLADPHADDQLDAWAHARDFPFPFTRAAVDAAGVTTLRLDP